MREWMERLVTMSLQAGILILFILLLQRLTKRHVSPRLRYALWLLPALRLLLPFTFESRASMMNLLPSPVGGAALQPGAPMEAVVLPLTPVPSLPAPSPVLPAAPAEVLPAAAAPDIWRVLFFVWAGGLALCAGYMLYVNLGFYARVRRERVKLDLGGSVEAYRMEGLSSPCLCGFLRPFILTNAAALTSKETLSLVLRHELCHKAQGDQWWGLLRNVCCAVHWFNPLVWWGAVRSRSDCELACDAMVMRGFSQAQCEDYGMALLHIIRDDGEKSEMISATTSMAGNCGCLRERIAGIGRRPKVRLWVTLGLVLGVAAASLAACSMGPAVETVPPGEILSTPTPPAAPTQTPEPVRTPFNTREHVAGYEGMTFYEQTDFFSTGVLSHWTQEQGFDEERREAAQSRMLRRFEEAGVTLPPDAAIEPAYYAVPDFAEKSGEQALFYATALTSAEASQGTRESTVALMLELEEDYFTLNVGADFPRYVASIVLQPERPARYQAFSFDQDEDGVTEYYVAFYRFDPSAAYRYDACYRLIQAGDTFLVEPIGGEEYAAMQQTRDERGLAESLKTFIRETAAKDMPTLSTSARGLHERGSLRIKDLYLPVSHSEGAVLNIDYEYDEAFQSKWSLTLDWPEGETLYGSFEASSYCPFNTTFMAADLNHDFKEEFIFHIVPIMSNTLMDGELHVFSQVDGALEEIFTLYSDHPELGDLAFPAEFRKLDAEADAGGMFRFFQSVSVVPFGSQNVLRFSAFSGENTSHTYLWQDFSGQWTVLDQTVQSQ